MKGRQNLSGVFLTFYRPRRGAEWRCPKLMAHSKWIWNSQFTSRFCNFSSFL